MEESILNLAGMYKAIRQKNIAQIKLFIKKGTPLDDHIYNFIDAATEYNSPEIVELLIKSGADINRSTPPILIRCIWENNPSIAEIVIKNGAQKDVRQEGDTALHMACRRGNKKMAKTLVENGLDIDSRNDELETPLHLAIRDGLEMVKILIDNGAQQSIESKIGETALEVARSMSRWDVVEFLSKKIWDRVRPLFFCRYCMSDSPFYFEKMPFDVFKTILFFTRMIKN